VEDGLAAARPVFDSEAIERTGCSDGPFVRDTGEPLDEATACVSVELNPGSESRTLDLICTAWRINVSKSLFKSLFARTCCGPPVPPLGAVLAAREPADLATVGATFGRAAEDWVPADDEAGLEATLEPDAGAVLLVVAADDPLGCAEDCPFGLVVAAGAVSVGGLEPKNLATAARDIA
jgi:hypothetical protein